jgi:hypothetical protein
MAGTLEIPDAIDIAFSLLARDEPTARELSRLIGRRLRVFLFTERQKELAFKDGPSAFTEVYESRAQLVVVLYREGYGGTKWTRLEETAITSRGVNLGWHTVLLISLDATKPVWLPASRLFYGLEQFGAEIAAEAIVERFAEQGAMPHPESTVELARRKVRRAAAREARENRERSTAAVNEVRDERIALYQAIGRVVADVQPEMPGVRLSPDQAEDVTFVISSPQGSISLTWEKRVGNNVTGSALHLREWGGPYTLPGRGVLIGGQGGMVRETFYVPSLSETDEWTWCHAPSFEPSPHYAPATGDRYTSDELAHLLVSRLIERIFPDDRDESPPLLIAVIPHRWRRLD